MNALQSLAHIPAQARRSLQHCKGESASMVRNDVRRRASRALASAMRAGLVCPAAVNKAVLAGDGAVAELMVNHAAPIPLPESLSQEFTAFCPTPMTSEAVATIKPLLFQLLEVGHIGYADIRQLDAKSFDKEAVTTLVETAFDRLCQRINQSLIDAGLLDSEARQPLQMTLTDNKWYIQCQDAFVMPVVADPESDPMFWGAYSAAIARIASCNHFIYPLTDGIEISEPFLSEILSDIRIRCGQVSRPDQIDPAILDDAADAIGIDQDYLAGTAPRYIALRALVESIPPLEFGSQSYLDWIAAAPADQAKLIADLHRLAEFSMSALNGKLEYDLDADGYAPCLIFLDCKHPYIDTAIDQFDQMAWNDSGFAASISVANASQILPVINNVLMHIAIANITFHQVERYECSH